MKSFLLTIIFSFLPVAAFAHGGGLNAAGCHNETRTGGYHCHRSSYTPPSSTSSLPAFIPELPDAVATKETEGIFTTGYKGLVFKNVKCINDKWRISLVNRTEYTIQSLEILFYTVDQDGDPLETYTKFVPYFGAKSREDYFLKKFSCSVPFKSLKYTFKRS
tara:strand:- start:210 stop:695 length:486 start_codon:yes stop_codon:yes gene_type:complete